MNDDTRRSWNLATRNHNAHKGDQKAFFRNGGDVLFPEELALLGDLSDREVVHLQCNAGQDSLGLVRRGARVTGVDLADEAIAFARELSAAADLPATFIAADVIDWLATTDARFDLAFTSYGTTGWLPDLGAWARGVARVLRPGGALVYVEFHPLIWSLGDEARLSGDDYFATAPFIEPVGDYVAASGEALGAVAGDGEVEVVDNTIPATCYQYGLGEVVTALVTAGLVLEALHEYPYANGCRLKPWLVPASGRRYVFPEGVARVPLMYGLRVRKH
jgi:SAM-dependent methyltransferase